MVLTQVGAYINITFSNAERSTLLADSLLENLIAEHRRIEEANTIQMPLLPTFNRIVARVRQLLI
jgi:hypothetical protein